MATGHKQIAKNTLFLYLRMILVLGVSLYTSRVLLQSLGVVDLGVYNLIGGVIVSLSFLNSSLAGASSRFITHALGEGLIEKIRRYYSTLQFLHIALALLFIIVTQLFAHYLVYSMLDIPTERADTAFWLLQLFSISTAASIISVPDSSLIMAHERMDIYAYVAIGEALLRLCAVILISRLEVDRLLYFGLFTLAIQLLVNLSYSLVSHYLFNEERAKPRYDKLIGKEVLGFVGWNASGSLSVIGYTQGLNILLNLFFGPIANAARGFAVQIQTAIENIILSFQTAVRPQIIKQYAQGQKEAVYTLILMSSKYGFYLTLLLVAPLLISIESVLNLWLGEIPPYTVEMSVIFLCVELISPFRIPLLSAIHATGNIRKFQIYEGIVLLMVVPVAYLLLKFAGISPSQVIGVYFLTEVIAQIVRLYIVTRSIGLSIRRYIRYLLPVVGVVLLSFAVSWSFQSYIQGNNLGAIFLRSTSSLLLILIIIYTIGLERNERAQIATLIKSKLKVWK
ncbi:lipopolysaccharide biosynthesis protein [Porphyromonas sp.]